jgi:hypothetical protein
MFLFPADLHFVDGSQETLYCRYVAWQERIEFSSVSNNTCVCEPGTIGFVVGAFSKRRQYYVYEYSITVKCRHGRAFRAAKLTVD